MTLGSDASDDDPLARILARLDSMEARFAQCMDAEFDGHVSWTFGAMLVVIGVVVALLSHNNTRRPAAGNGAAGNRRSHASLFGAGKDTGN